MRTFQKYLFAGVAGYFLLHLLSRVLISDTANLDEAEQLVLAQRLQWGYASQPPLYTWLQALFFTAFGINIFALALLKNTLLFTTYVFAYLTAKLVTGEKKAGLLALLGLLFVPQIVWESQRDLTHSVLTTTVASATIFCSIKLFQTRKTVYYLLIGLCAALGVLSKYNYAIFLAALLVSAMSLRETRPTVLDKRILLSIALFAFLTWPHFYWASTEPAAVFAQAEKLHVSKTSDQWAQPVKGLTSLITATAGFFLPLSLVYLALCKWTGLRDLFNPRNHAEKLFYRTILVGLAFCLIAVFCFEARFKDRWMQPLLFLAPVYFSLRLWQKLDGAKLRTFGIVSGTIAATVLILLPLGTLSSSLRKKQTRLNAPYSDLAKQLQGHFRTGLILAESRLVGGNLKLIFRDSDVLVPELPHVSLPQDAPRLVVWNATHFTNMPPHLVRFVADLGLVQSNMSQMKASYLASPFKYSANESMRLGFMIFPPENNPQRPHDLSSNR